MTGWGASRVVGAGSGLGYRAGWGSELRRRAVPAIGVRTAGAGAVKACLNYSERTAGAVCWREELLLRRNPEPVTGDHAAARGGEWIDTPHRPRGECGCGLFALGLRERACVDMGGDLPAACTRPAVHDARQRNGGRVHTVHNYEYSRQTLPALAHATRAYGRYTKFIHCAQFVRANDGRKRYYGQPVCTEPRSPCQSHCGTQSL
jgi:hypothetical protein